MMPFGSPSQVGVRLEMLEEARVVAAIAQDNFGEQLVAVYLFGSSVSRGLRPQSDVEVLVVIDHPMTQTVRERLLASLLIVSGRHPTGPGKPRCIELTVLLKCELAALAFPAKCEFLYDEWLRDDFERGELPTPFSDPGSP